MRNMRIAPKRTDAPHPSPKRHKENKKLHTETQDSDPKTTNPGMQETPSRTAQRQLAQQTKQTPNETK